MTRKRTLGSVFWALVLVAVGGLLLARNLGYSLPIWQVLAVYWPALIVGWGLLKVVDYYRLRGERSVFSGGEVALLVFVLIVGSAFSTAANMTSDPGFLGLIGEELDLFDLLGESYQFSSEIELAVVSGSVIEIHNGYGTVEIEAGSDSRLVVAVEKNVRAASREAAEEIEPELEFTIEGQAGRYVVDSNRRVLGDSMRRRFRTSLRIQVPREASVEVDNSYGPVRVTGLVGDQVIDNRYGGISLDQIEGDVRVEDRYGPVFARAVSGSVTVVNRYGTVEIDQVGGDTSVQNRYARVDITNVAGRTDVTNRYSQVSVRDAGGDVRVGGRNNRVELADITGAVDVDTSYREVEGRNLRDRVTIAVRHADVLLRFDDAPSADVTVNGDYSDIRVELPIESEFSLDAETRSGSFDSDFEGFGREELGRNLRIVGQRGISGPRLTISTARGDIRLAGD